MTIMTYSEAQKRATMKWEAQNYEQIRFTVPKGMKQEIKDCAEAHGMKMRAFIIEAIKTKMEETK